MNEPRQTKHLLERRKAEVIGWLVEGKPVGEIAKLVSTKKQQVTSQAVCAFRKRHLAEIAPVVAEIEKQITDYAIANVVNRVRDAQLRRDLLARVQELRAAGGDGMETGIVAKSYKSIGSGPFAQVVEEYRVDTAFLAEWRANEEHVASQLDQLPRGTKAGADTYNIGQAVLVRYVEGTS